MLFCPPQPSEKPSAPDAAEDAGAYDWSDFADISIDFSRQGNEKTVRMGGVTHSPIVKFTDGIVEDLRDARDSEGRELSRTQQDDVQFSAREYACDASPEGNWGEIVLYSERDPNLEKLNRALEKECAAQYPGTFASGP